jgi:hypothetical protein
MALQNIRLEGIKVQSLHSEQVKEISHVLGQRMQPINQKKKGSAIQIKRISYMRTFPLVQEKGGYG